MWGWKSLASHFLFIVFFSFSLLVWRPQKWNTPWPYLTDTTWPKKVWYVSKSKHCGYKLNMECIFLAFCLLVLFFVFIYLLFLYSKLLNKCAISNCFNKGWIIFYVVYQSKSNSQRLSLIYFLCFARNNSRFENCSITFLPIFSKRNKFAASLIYWSPF